jgi:hypothetical protein
VFKIECASAFRYPHGKKLKPWTETEISETIDLISFYGPLEPSVTDSTTTASGVLVPKCLDTGAFLRNRDGPVANYPTSSSVIDDFVGTGLIHDDKRIGHPLG